MKAVISGATRGIGKAIAKHLYSKGYELVLLARTKKDLLHLAEELDNSVSKISVLSVDMSAEGFEKKLQESSAIFNNCTVLINNVGIYDVHHINETTSENTLDQLRKNLLSAVGLTNFIMQNKNLKNIVNVGSVMSLEANYNATTYSISKHAFKGWNDSLREGLRDGKTKVTAIYPGAVNTSSWDGIPANREEMIQPEDIANCVEMILNMNENTLLEEIRLSPRNFNP